MNKSIDDSRMNIEQYNLLFLYFFFEEREIIMMASVRTSTKKYLISLGFIKISLPFSRANLSSKIPSLFQIMAETTYSWICR